MQDIPTTTPNQPAFFTMRQLARDASDAKRERCDLCGEPLPTQHRHLLDLTTKQISCACQGCSILFSTPAAGRGMRQLIPNRTKALAGFELSDAQWEAMHLPVNMAFFFHDSATDRVVALYPSPAGATESLLEMDTWDQLTEQNPVLKQMAPDVEALLVNRVRSTHDYFIAPIDECYKLVGMLRLHWRGLGGGTHVWEEINLFFADLKAHAKTIGGADA